MDNSRIPPEVKEWLELYGPQEAEMSPHRQRAKPEREAGRSRPPEPEVNDPVADTGGNAEAAAMGETFGGSPAPPAPLPAGEGRDGAEPALREDAAAESTVPAEQDSKMASPMDEQVGKPALRERDIPPGERDEIPSLALWWEMLERAAAARGATGEKGKGGAAKSGAVPAAARGEAPRKRKQDEPSQREVARLIDQWVRPSEEHLLMAQWANRVHTLPVDWLWNRRMPKGRLVLLAGDPGIGKSLVALDIAARVSSGAPWPDLPGSQRPPANVMVFSMEDDVRDTIVPRLKASGAALNRVCLVDGIARTLPFRQDEFKRRFVVPEDISSLLPLVAALAPLGLIVFDPIMAYCGKGEGSGVSTIHAMLAPLAEFAGRTNITILCTIHLKKGAGGQAIYRMAGNPAFTTASRAVWGLVRHPKQKGKRLMVPVKMNLGPDSDGLAYQIGAQGKLTWEPEAVEIDPDEAFSAQSRKEDSRLAEAEAFLSDVLSAGDQPASLIKKWADEHGIAAGTLRRARERLDVVPLRKGNGKAHRAFWSLGPESAPVPAEVGTCAAGIDVPSAQHAAQE